jgi:hypothetical protein
MNAEELDAIVESKLAEQLEARLQADRQRIRAEVVDQIRREESRKHYDRINAKHPIEDKYGGLGPEGHAARLRQMDAARARAAAHMDEVNSRPVPGGLLDQRSRAALVPGAEGFAIKGVGQR